jgi:hypothetical protein
VGTLVVWLTAVATILGPMALISPLAAAIIAGVLLWFAYPIGLMCAMDAHNSLALIYLPLLGQLARHLPKVLLVGFATLPMGAAVVGLLVAAMLHSTAWAVPAAVVLPLALFLYARCWGRLAWLALNMKRRRQREKAPLPKEASVTVLDPWAPPPEEPIPEMDVEVEEPEPLAEEDDEWAANPRPYEVPPAESGAPLPFSNEEYYEQYRKRERERKARAEGRKPGEKRRRTSLGTAFGPDFWGFLAIHRTRRAAASLAALTLAFLVLLRIAMLMFPHG